MAENNTSDGALHGQVEFVKSRVEKVENTIDSMRAEVANGQQSLRQEFATSLHSVKNEVGAQIQSVMGAIEKLGGDVSKGHRPNWAVLFGLIGLLFTGGSSVAYLASRYYDGELLRVERRLDEHDAVIVPRDEYKRLADSVTANTIHERETAIWSALALDRTNRSRP